MSTPWQLLGIAQTASVREVRSRYAALLKHNRPEDNPLGFQQLREAYEACLEAARQLERQGSSSDVAAPAMPPPAPRQAAPGIAPEAAAAPVVPAAPVTPVAPEPVATQAPPAVELPPLRDPGQVAQALLSLDRGTPQDSDAFARAFRECEELASFVTRDDVELELLRRITDGARPTLRALRLFGTTFGWRQLGHERRLLRLGVPRDALQSIDDALFRAGSEAQFEWHLETKRRLLANHLVDYADELRLVQTLHAQRNTPPRLRELLRWTQVKNVNALLEAWARTYGPAATGYLFGPDNVHRWRRMSPAAEFNLQQALGLSVLYAVHIGWVVAVIVGLSFALMAGSFADRAETMGHMLPGLTTIALLLLLALVVGPYALRLIATAANRIGADCRRWRERYLVPWLAPRRAMLLFAVLGTLSAFAVYQDQGFPALLATAGMAVAAFGWRSLAVLALDAGFIWCCTAVGTGNNFLLSAMAAAAAALPLLWVSDRLACHAAPQMDFRLRWVRLLGISFGVGVGALFALVLAVSNLQ